MTQPRVGVVGGGRVGAVLASRFQSAGHPISAVSGRSTTSRTRIASLLHGVDIRELVDVARSCDVLVIAVPDDSLASVAADLAHVVHPGQIVLHTSGRHGRAILEPLARAGARTMALHPAMTFTGTELDLHRPCVFGATVLPADRDIAETLISALGGRTMWIGEDDRSTYHAALAHGANHLSTIVNQAMDLLRSIGADNPAAVLRPLLEASLDNTLAFGDDALTGPVVRGDVDTVRAHIDTIGDRSIENTYLAMAAATTDRAEASGRLDPSVADEIRASLSVEKAR